MSTARNFITTGAGFQQGEGDDNMSYDQEGLSGHNEDADDDDDLSFDEPSSSRRENDHLGSLNDYGDGNGDGNVDGNGDGNGRRRVARRNSRSQVSLGGGTMAASPTASSSSTGTGLGSSSSNNADYVARLRSQYKKVPAKPQKDLSSIAETGSNLSDVEVALSAYSQVATATTDNTTSTSTAKSSNFTDIKSLKEKYKQRDVQKHSRKSSSNKILNRHLTAASRNSVGASFNSENESPLFRPVYDFYGEKSGLTSNQNHAVDPSSSAGSGGHGHGFGMPPPQTSRRFNIMNALPFARTTDNSVSSSRNESIAGNSYERDRERDKDALLSENAIFLGPSESMAAACAVVRHGQGVKTRNFRNKEYVLIALPWCTEEVERKSELELCPPSVCPVNKFGYPEGAGKEDKHKQGPFEYVLATVVMLHFAEDAPTYTVQRADTYSWVKADSASMEPIEEGSDAFNAAYLAADQKDENQAFAKATQILNNAWVKPFFSSIKKSSGWLCSVLKDQANKLTSGAKPYNCEFTFSSVNITVICSLIVAFCDQLKHTFFTKIMDFPLSVLLFIAWIVLIFELFSQLCIRPANYGELLKNEQAYCPSTVLYINRFHFWLEGLALVFVVPDFLIIFGVKNCFINSAKAAIYTAVGGEKDYDWWPYVLGYFYLFTTRLRLLCLLRHKRTNWLNKDYFSEERTADIDSDIISTDTTTKTDKITDRSKNEDDWKRKQKNCEDYDLLPKAAKIGTALLLVNSHLAILLLLLIIVVVPFFTCEVSGGRNRTIYHMADYLHHINKSDYFRSNCELLEDSTQGWLKANEVMLNNDYVMDSNNLPKILFAQLLPKDDCFESRASNIIRPSACFHENISEEMKNMCSYLPEGDTTNDDLYKILKLRRGSLVFYDNNTTTTEGEWRQTKVIYNLKDTVSRSNFNSLILQLFMLALLLGSVAYLRNDCNRLVIRPLRRLLRIVLRYGSNPLSATPSNESEKKRLTAKNIQNCHVEDFGSLELDFDLSGKDKLGSFETERLITAVRKITDLLRKCWGVAGAGIISSNLARNMKGDTVVFNPTVPGKNVYALFGFVGINDYGVILRSLENDAMTLINDIAVVLHNEVYRWGLGESGQCNKNLGAAFLMVYRIGDFEEVRKKNDEAKKVIFASQNDLQSSIQAGSNRRLSLEDELNSIHLASLPGINAFGDRAVLGLLKSFAGINREESVKAWEKDYRIGSGVNAFNVGINFGMDAGWAVEGAVGSNHKIDATYLSSHVNMASRMMSACKQYGVAILLSQAVEELLSKECKAKLRHLDTVYVKGSKSPQRVYTYDARHKGIDFFLNKRSDEQADKEAVRYSPQIWDKDQDLQEMRSHVSTEFLNTYAKGLKLYLIGSWKDAAKQLRQANETMIKDIVESGRIEVVNSTKGKILDSSTKDDDAIYKREEFGDGACQTLISYIKNRDYTPPENWHGVRELTSK